MFHSNIQTYSTIDIVLNEMIMQFILFQILQKSLNDDLKCIYYGLNIE